MCAEKDDLLAEQWVTSTQDSNRIPCIGVLDLSHLTRKLHRRAIRQLRNRVESVIIQRNYVEVAESQFISARALETRRKSWQFLSARFPMGFRVGRRTH